MPLIRTVEASQEIREREKKQKSEAEGSTSQKKLERSHRIQVISSKLEQEAEVEAFEPITQKSPSGCYPLKQRSTWI